MNEWRTTENVDYINIAGYHIELENYPFVDNEWLIKCPPLKIENETICAKTDTEAREKAIKRVDQAAREGLDDLKFLLEQLENIEE